MVYSRNIVVNQLDCFLSPGIWLRVACDIRIEDKVLRVFDAVLRPKLHSRKTAPSGILSSKSIRVQIVNEADPRAIHEARQLCIRLPFSLKWRSFHDFGIPNTLQIVEH